MVVSLIFYVHPDPWGNDPILPTCFRWVGEKPPTSYGKYPMIYDDFAVPAQTTSPYLPPLEIANIRERQTCLRGSRYVSSKEYTNYISNGIYHGPPKPTFLEVFMVNNLVFRWPKHLRFIGGI